MKNPRRKLMVGFAIAAGVLTLSSTAFACTIWKGRLTVSVASGGSGTVTGWGANLGMQHCPTMPWQGTAQVHAGSNGPTPPAHASGSVNVTVAPTTSTEVGICASKLKAGTHDINFLNTGLGDFVGTGPAREWVHDCMTGGHPKTFKIGSITVDSNGNGAASNVVIDKPGRTGTNEIQDWPGMESAICVSTTDAAEGMQNPIIVI
jgi:hypothetical protein